MGRQADWTCKECGKLAIVKLNGVTYCWKHFGDALKVEVPKMKALMAKRYVKKARAGSVNRQDSADIAANQAPKPAPNNKPVQVVSPDPSGDSGTPEPAPADTQERLFG